VGCGGGGGGGVWWVFVCGAVTRTQGEERTSITQEKAKHFSLEGKEKRTRAKGEKGSNHMRRGKKRMPKERKRTASRSVCEGVKEASKGPFLQAKERRGRGVSGAWTGQEERGGT